MELKELGQRYFPVLYTALKQSRDKKKISGRTQKAFRLRESNGLSSEALDLPKPSFLSLLAIIRGEDLYLVEWIEFHKMMGVDHFFLYDNGDDEPTKRVLAPYLESGEVSLIPFPDMKGLKDVHDEETLSIQDMAYGDFALRYRHNCTWTLIVDVDEFVFPRKESGFSRIIDYLQKLDANRVMGLVIPMYPFGSNAHRSRPEGLVIPNFTTRGERPNHVKSLVNARFLKRVPHQSVHYSLYQIALFKKMHWPDKVLRINHYWIKSYEEYVRKREINNVGYMAGHESDERFFLHDSLSQGHFDDDIFCYLEELSKRVQRVNSL